MSNTSANTLGQRVSSRNKVLRSLRYRLQRVASSSRIIYQTTIGKKHPQRLLSRPHFAEKCLCSFQCDGFAPCGVKLPQRGLSGSATHNTAAGEPRAGPALQWRGPPSAQLPLTGPPPPLAPGRTGSGWGGGEESPAAPQHERSRRVCPSSIHNATRHRSRTLMTNYRPAQPRPV